MYIHVILWVIASMGVCPLLAVPYSLLPGPLSPKA